MAKILSPAAANHRAQIETPLVFSANPCEMQGYTLSKSDGEFLTTLASHWLDAGLSGNSSKAETCSKLMASFCVKFTQGVAHD